MILKEEHFIDKYFIMALYFHSVSFKKYVMIETNIRMEEKVTDIDRCKNACTNVIRNTAGKVLF